VSEKTVCRTCKFWEAAEDNEPLGKCHRYPPTPVILEPCNEHYLWPTTKESDFCGDWEMRSMAD